MSFLDGIPEIRDHNNEVNYADADIRQRATTVVGLANSGKRYSGLLAVRTGILPFPDKVEFAVFDFCSSDTDGANATWSRVFHGEGFAGGLRELRHTYWGDPDAGGYVFYPDGELIAEAFAQLSEWFDCGKIPVRHDVERIAAWVQGDGTDAQRVALADGIRAGRHA